MPRPTVASLAADLAAANKVISTYVGQVNTLHERVKALEADLAAATDTGALTNNARVRAYANTTFAQAVAARKAASAKFFELNPTARSVTDGELISMGFLQ